MTGEVIGNLLRPLIGKSGTIFMAVSRSGQFGFATGPDRPHVSLDGGYNFLLMPSQEQQLINEYFNKSHHGKGDSPAYPVRDMHDAPDQNSGEENGPDVVGDP